MNASNAIRTGK